LVSVTVSRHPFIYCMYVCKKTACTSKKCVVENFFIYKEWTGCNRVQSQIWGGLCCEETRFLPNFLFFLTVCGTAQARISPYKYRGRIQRKTWCMGPYAGVDNVHSRVDTNTFTMNNPIQESTLTLCQGRLYSPVEDFMKLASGQPELAAQIYHSTRE